MPYFKTAGIAHDVDAGGLNAKKVEVMTTVRIFVTFRPIPSNKHNKILLSRSVSGHTRMRSKNYIYSHPSHNIDFSVFTPAGKAQHTLPSIKSNITFKKYLNLSNLLIIVSKGGEGWDIHNAQ